MVCRKLVGVVMLSGILFSGVACTRSIEGLSQADPADLATVQGEKAIRAIVAEQNTALANLDFAKLSSTICSKLRDKAQKFAAPPPVPPMDKIAPPDLVAKPEFPVVARKLLAEKFPNASPDVIGAIVDSLVAQDQKAYEVAMRNLMKEIFSVKITNVANFDVKGDQATADITVSLTQADQPPVTNTKINKYTRENGKWYDCDPQALS